MVESINTDSRSRVSSHTIINLLIVDRSLTDIEEIAKHLRSAGFVVEPLHAAESREAQRIIEEKPLDLVIARLREGLPGIDEIHGWIGDGLKDIPVLAALGRADSASPARLLDAGAAALVWPEDPEQLVRVVARELHHLETRRQLRRAENMIEESERRSRLLLDSSRDAIAYVHEGAHIYANPAWLDMFGYQDLTDLEAVTVMNLVGRKDREALKSFLRRCGKGGQSLKPVDLEGLRSDGSSVPLQWSCAPARYRGESCVQVLVRDPNEQGGCQDLQRELERLQKYDQLTDLYNRRYFTDYLNQVQARAARDNNGGALLYILITGYRSVVERHGLLAGDQLIQDSARLLQKLVRDDEVAARFSDCSFALHTPRTRREDILALAERICDAIKDKDFQANRQLVTTACSIGACMVGEARQDVGELIAQADRACETARLMGGNQIQFYNPASAGKEADADTLQELKKLQDAFSQGRSNLLFQPIASLTGDDQQRYKALLALRGPEGRPMAVPPLTALAEEHGQMREPDRWTLTRGLEILAERRLAGHPIVLFVRLSRNSLADAEFGQWLEQRCRDETPADGGLVLEIPEDCAQRYFKEAKELRQRLQSSGCHLALSHFGRGETSETALRHLTPDYIKLDGELIEKASREPELERRLRQLTEQARAQGTRIIADRVSNAAQLARIWQFGVTLVQGDLVQAPSPDMRFDFAQFVG